MSQDPRERDGNDDRRSLDASGAFAMAVVVGVVVAVLLVLFALVALLGVNPFSA
ncbi:hypothetical protein [Oryzobacter telluris]|uniref:hypothetical protein n=1 Tax=Oryzobacter telluris TaxID=3149179 RepID=UPI00370DA933